MHIRTSRRSTLALCSALATAGFLAAGLASSAKAAVGAPRVDTTSGAVAGLVQNGLYEYLGIPYAAPPVGALRWQPPADPAAWNGVRQTVAFGPTCAQITELGVFAGPANNNEDCLYLNVFTTNPGASKKSLKPVLMWIHGGGLVDGESNDYDASKLAKGGPGGATVIVTINYRLGLLGYLAHPALDAEGHNFGNYGLMDQQRALHWIRDNIAAFGGDPKNVTVGGQSAGSTSTQANMISPLSKGLFNQSIFESSTLLTVAPLSFAEQQGAAFGTAAGCPADSSPAAAACLRNIAVPAIMNLQGTPSANGPYVIGLMVDGTVLPLAGDTAFSTGAFTHMPVMTGSAHDEGGFTASINEYFFGPLTAAQYTAKVQATFSGPASPGGANYPAGTGDAVLAQYPLSNYASPSLAFVAENSDQTSCKERHLNHLLNGKVPVYAYEFEDKAAPWYFSDLSFPQGAAHTIDIQFLFPNWHGGPLGAQHRLTKPEEKLSNELVGAWTSFMYAGNPNLIGTTPWPAYRTAKENYLSEAVGHLSMIRGNAYQNDHNCAFWDATLVY